MVEKLGIGGTTPMAKEFASNELPNDAGRGGSGVKRVEL